MSLPSAQVGSTDVVDALNTVCFNGSGKCAAGFAELKTQANGGQVLHTVSSTHVYTHTIAADVVVVDSDGSTLLPFYMQNYSATGGLTEIVFVKSRSHTVNGTVYVCVGNGSVATDQSNPAGICTVSNHLQNLWTFPDGSTPDAHDVCGATNGTLANVTAVAGDIDGAAHFNGTTADVNLGAFSVPTTYSMISWVKANVDPVTVSSQVFGARETSPNVKVVDMQLDGGHAPADNSVIAGCYNNGDDKRASCRIDGTTDSGCTVAITSGAYFALAVSSASGGNTTLYVNGQTGNVNGTMTKASSDACWDTTATTAYLGFDSIDVDFAPIDLNRHAVYATALDASAITADFNNLSAPNTFAPLGAWVGSGALKRTGRIIQ